MVMGLLLITAALCLVLYNTWDSRRAGIASESAREELVLSIGQKLSTHEAPAAQTTISAPSALQGTQKPDAPEAAAAAEPIARIYENCPTLPDEVPAVPVMATETLDGENSIGIVEIPGLNLSLPVIENWDYEKLKIAPCRYCGSYYMNDLVICGHNYAEHFASLQYIKIGEDVYFTTMNGEAIHYIVSNRQTVLPQQIDTMIDNTQEKWDLTLFTCYTGGRTRCAVRCIRVDE